jgi:hypothetical protein
MGKTRRLDTINQEIIRVLSLYNDLSLLELWFEIGEAGALKPMTKEQVSSRLESLMAQGFVERIPFVDGEIRWALKGSSKRGAKGTQMFQEAGGSQGEYIRRKEGEKR